MGGDSPGDTGGEGKSFAEDWTKNGSENDSPGQGRRNLFLDKEHSH